MNTKLKPEDQALFRSAMRGVRPLTQTQPRIKPEPARVKLKRRALPEQRLSAADPFSDHEYLDLVEGDEPLAFSRSGIAAKELRSLRRGQERPEAVLDLHGKTVEEARSSLHQFLLACQTQGKTRVLIIHGKGRGKEKPILKNKLNHWLRQREEVMVFCSAKVRDGGTGALYLRLKKTR